MFRWLPIGLVYMRRRKLRLIHIFASILHCASCCLGCSEPRRDKHDCGCGDGRR